MDIHGTAKAKAVPADHLDDVLTAGAGFRGMLDSVHYHVDYAWADQGRLDNTQRFSFGITF